ncbi:peptide/nickel transport system ATP-binding protein [Cohaesibacter sp. ES.047]|uniref:ABC transporter ATP-binding protein n=1 Tax=Cohaesibacter sp. ES.047 TaxID=1798205 RepID=UPI000BB7ACE5|nr:ABC transporter ATP-binding protein [Cohaesibacter sp. ES.047]SNY90715.1 peptide/nickel transport system ATP-binding protein [Cohaesibacter sp. ES.047]
MLEAQQQDLERPVLEVDNLSLEFRSSSGTVRALDDVSLSVGKGEILALVGESGCGKSVTAMTVMGLLPRHNARILSGSVQLSGEELIGASEKTMRQIRGARIGMVFQDPMSSLNPVHTIGLQISEAVREHWQWDWSKSTQRAKDMLDFVRIPDAASRLSSYPHELSGGMRQRVMIAMALACDPELLIADEPTTALDVTVQAQVLDLISDLRSEFGMSVLLITHDLGVVSSHADRMMVMYAGRVVENAPIEDLFSRPSHGYTAGLLASLPGIGSAHRSMLHEIEGAVPRLEGSLPSCSFAPRCAFASEQCLSEAPAMRQIAPHHMSRCVHDADVFQTVSKLDIVRAWSS